MPTCAQVAQEVQLVRHVGLGRECIGDGTGASAGQELAGLPHGEDFCCHDASILCGHGSRVELE